MLVGLRLTCQPDSLSGGAGLRVQPNFPSAPWSNQLLLQKSAPSVPRQSLSLRRHAAVKSVEFV